MDNTVDQGAKLLVQVAAPVVEAQNTPLPASDVQMSDAPDVQEEQVQETAALPEDEQEGGQMDVLVEEDAGPSTEVPWDQEPEYLTASDRGPNPEGLTAYQEPVWVHPEHPEDTTSFHPGQAKWSSTHQHIPRVLLRVFETRSWRAATGVKSRALQKRDDAGDPMYEEFPDFPSDPRPLLDYPILPDRIGTWEEPFRFEAWRRLDPRIEWSDIHMRMVSKDRPSINCLNMNALRWRRKNWLTSWHEKGRNKKQNKNKEMVLEKITPTQLASNDTSGLERETWGQPDRTKPIHIRENAAKRKREKAEARASANDTPATDMDDDQNHPRKKGKGKEPAAPRITGRTFPDVDSVDWDDYDLDSSQSRRAHNDGDVDSADNTEDDSLVDKFKDPWAEEEKTGMPSDDSLIGPESSTRSCSSADQSSESAHSHDDDQGWKNCEECQHNIATRGTHLPSRSPTPAPLPDLTPNQRALLDVVSRMDPNDPEPWKSSDAFLAPQYATFDHRSGR